MPWRSWFFLFPLLLLSALSVYASSTVRLPELMVAGTLSFQQEEALKQLRRELVQKSGNSSVRKAPLLIPGTAVAALLSQQTGTAVIVTPPWIGILPENLKGEHILFWKMLFLEMEKHISTCRKSGDTIFVFDSVPLSMDSLLPGKSEKKLTFFAPDVLLKAMEQALMRKSGRGSETVTELMIPVRLSSSGNSRVAMVNLNILTLQGSSSAPSRKVGEELMVVYQGEGIRLRFPGRIDRVDRDGGTVSVRPLSNLFSSATAGNTIRRFEASITENGEADVQIGGEQQ